MKPEARLITDKIYAKGDATHRLMEHLEYDDAKKASFELSTIDKRIKSITEAVHEMTFREALMSGAEGAVAKLLDVVWLSALPDLVGRELAHVMTGTTPSIRVPKATKAKAYRVGEAGGVRETAEKYSYTEIVARLWESMPVVSRSLVEDCSWDVIARQYAEGARAIAEAETAEIVAAMTADASTTPAGHADGDFDLSDIAELCKDLEGRDYHPTHICCHPQNYWELFKDTQIAAAMNFGKPTAISGQINQILGLTIVRTSKATADSPFALDYNRAGVLYIRRDITIEDYEDPVKDLAGAVLTSRFRYKTVDTGAIATLDTI